MLSKQASMEPLHILKNSICFTNCTIPQYC